MRSPCFGNNSTRAATGAWLAARGVRGRGRSAPIDENLAVLTMMTTRRSRFRVVRFRVFVFQGWDVHKDDQGRKYYANKATLQTQWQHPMEEYYKGVVFMRKEGEQLLEEKASRSPPTPEETREMARYFGIDTKTELDLLEIAKAAVNAPLPPEWEEYEDDSGEVLFYNIVTKKTSEHHPLDAYFLELVRQRRALRKAREGDDHDPAAEAEARAQTYGVGDFWNLNEDYIPHPWMEFVHPKNGQLYFYNFKENTAAYCHPVHLIREKLKSLAVINVQKMFRGWKARKDAVSDEAHAAARKIQTAFRAGRKKDDRAAKERAILEKAVVRIQRAWRQRLAELEVEREEESSAAVVIQRQFKIRLARKRAALREKLGPMALPPYVENVLPPPKQLKASVAELLASPSPFTAALEELDAFAVETEAGTETRLPKPAAEDGERTRQVTGTPPSSPPRGKGDAEVAGVEGGGSIPGGGEEGDESGPPAPESYGGQGPAPPTPVAPLRSELLEAMEKEDGGLDGVQEELGQESSATDTASLASETTSNASGTKKKKKLKKKASTKKKAGGN